MEEKTMKLTIPLSSQEERRFIRVPFSVPDRCESLCVTYALDDSEAANVDLALEEPGGFRGWSGYTTGTVHIGPKKTTPGYYPGYPPEGQWKAVLGVPKLLKECSVTLTITTRPRSFNWYPGDFHIHTFHSDGQFSVESAVDFSRELGLSFLALTDHNTQTQNIGISGESDPVLIPSMELTTYRGHLNFWNLSRSMKNILCDTRKQVDEAISEARKQGALVSINHPFFRDPWIWGTFPETDAVEVWNGPWDPGNRKALEWWHEQLCRGQRICALGGSDNHRFNHDGRWFGTPTTWAGTDRFDIPGIMEAIRSLRIIITAAPESPRVHLESASPGTALVTVKGESRGILGLFSEKGLEEEFDMAKKESRFEYSTTGDRVFIRGELWEDKENRKPLCITNPIFFNIDLYKEELRG